MPENIGKINSLLEELHGKNFKIKILTAKEYDNLALTNKDTTTGAQEAKSLFEAIKSQINFDIQEI